MPDPWSPCCRFYFSRGANCCLEIRALLECDPAGDCRGFAGDCADIQAQFSGVQGPYLYGEPGVPPEEHTYLDDWVCHAFPDDAYITDQFLVALISVAVALPIDLLLARAFEIANEGDAVECWLDAPPGTWKLLLGKDAHNAWHYTDAAREKPVSDFVKWLVRRGSETLPAALLRLAAWLRRRLFGAPAEDEDEQTDDVHKASGASDVSDASADARADAVAKRLYASVGLLGVYACWCVKA
jgi:hypothetical protein